MTRLFAVSAIVCLGAALTGCAGMRQTTTTRSPIEQALMSRSVADTIDTITIQGFEGKSYRIESDSMVSPDKDLILGMLEEKLLTAGLKNSPIQDEADIVVKPYAEYTGIDEGVFLIGFPNFDIPTSQGTISTPELALFKRGVQRGKHEVGLYGFYSEDGSLAMSHDSVPAKRYYVRHTILFIFNFRKTDLGSPF